MDTEFLCNTELFRGSVASDVPEMLKCLGGSTRRYAKGETVLREGGVTEKMGLVLSGGLNIETDDAWGNRTILGRVGAGELFAETYACIPGQQMLVSVEAAEASEVLFLSARRLLTPCASACAYHSLLIRNLLAITAQKNLSLSRRSLHTAAKTIRGRVLSYLSDAAQQGGGRSFTIPFDRQGLADYLGVERSALSGELGKMRREGLIAFEKNRFTLL